MPQPVFISYARATSQESAVALHRELGPATCFLDSNDIEHGAKFPRALVDALLASRVFVAFIDEKYFTRWYCLREWLIARAAHDELMRRGSVQSQLERALDHVVLAFPDGSFDSRRLPPSLQATNWPPARDTGSVAALVRARLDGPEVTLASRLDAAGVPSWRRESLIAEAAMPAPRNLAGVPMYPKSLPQSLGSGFVGRVDDIWRMHVALTEPRLGSMQIAALTGAVQGGGGFGKTQLAREYLHRFGPSDFAGGLFWIDATEAESLERQFHGVLSELREVPPVEDMREGGRDVVRELADALHEDAAASAILFVIDNVPEPAPASVPASLDRWCPALGKVTCLATSRKRLDDLGSADAIDIDVLESEAAAKLLQLGVPSPERLAPEDWGSIADWVGRLPLALTLLNAALRKGAISPRKLLSSSKGEGPVGVLDAQMDALRGSVRAGVLRGITEAFQLSYELLDEPSRRLGRRIAWLSPAPIPDELLDALSADASPVSLVDRSFLLECQSKGSPTRDGRQMHRVLADFLRTRSDDRRAEQHEADRALCSVMEDLDLDEPDARSLGMLLVMHALMVADRIGARTHEEPSMSTVDDWKTIVRMASRVDDVGTRSGECAALEVAVRLYHTALGLARRDRAPLDWAMTQNNLANVLSRLGEREEGTKRLEEAVSACRAALEVYTRDRAPLDWAMTHNNLGTMLTRLGEREEGTKRLEEAVSAYRAALEIYTRDRAPLGWATTHNNLGTVLATLGEREEGRKHLEEAVSAYRAALEVRTRDRAPLDWAMTQNNLGTVLTRLGEREEGTKRLEGAVSAYRAALEVCTRDRAPLDWAMTQNNLGTVLMTLGEREEGTKRLEEAVSAYRASLEVRTRVRAPLEWGRTQYNLGDALRALGEREEGTKRLKEAVSAHRAALEARTRDRAPLDWAKTQNNLGNALTALGEREKGTKRLEEAISTYRAASCVLGASGSDYYSAVVQRNLERVETLLRRRRTGR